MFNIQINNNYSRFQNLSKIECKGYIPLQRKTIRVGSWRWLRSKRQNFALGIRTCWYLKTLKFAFPPTRNIKFALPPIQNPNASQWNIGCVGSPTQNFGIGHVHLILFVLISFALVTQREHSLQWNMGLKCTKIMKLLEYLQMYCALPNMQENPSSFA